LDINVSPSASFDQFGINELIGFLFEQNCPSNMRFAYLLYGALWVGRHEPCGPISDNIMIRGCIVWYTCWSFHPVCLFWLCM